MKQIQPLEPFRPADLGVQSTWGFIIQGVGTSTLQIRIEGEWEDVRVFEEPDTYLDDMRRDATYQFSAIDADAVFII